MERYKDNLNKTTCEYLDLVIIYWFHEINDYCNSKCTVQRPLKENTRKSTGGGRLNDVRHKMSVWL